MGSRGLIDQERLLFIGHYRRDNEKGHSTVHKGRGEVTWSPKNYSIKSGS